MHQSWGKIGAKWLHRRNLHGVQSVTNKYFNLFCTRKILGGDRLEMGSFESVQKTFLDSETLCREAEYGKMPSVARAIMTH